MYLGEYEIDEYVELWATTHRFSSGAAYAATSITYRVYEDGNTTEIIGDTTMGAAFDSVTGLYLIRLQLTAAAGFEVGKSYAAVIQATVDGIAAISVQRWRVKFPAVNVAQWLGTAAHAATVAGVPVVQLHNSAGTGGINAPANFEDLSITDTTGLVSCPTTQKVDIETIKTQAVTCAAGVTVLANVGFAGAPGANNGAPTTNGSKLNQTVDLTAGQTIGITPAATGAIATDAGNSATTFKTDLASAVDNFYNRCLIRLTSGALNGQVDKITDYDGTDKIITIQTGFTATPADGVTFAIENQ